MRSSKKSVYTVHGTESKKIKWNIMFKTAKIFTIQIVSILIDCTMICLNFPLPRVEHLKSLFIICVESLNKFQIEFHCLLDWSGSNWIDQNGVCHSLDWFDLCTLFSVLSSFFLYLIRLRHISLYRKKDW